MDALANPKGARSNRCSEEEAQQVLAGPPRWQAVLAEIAACLNTAGIDFHLTGGTAVALQGVPIPVKDVDIEMDAQGIYQFQQIFSSRAIQPVAYVEGQLYRSHFGRFDIDGVIVEVMADLEWHYEQGWKPVGTRYMNTVHVEGVPVQVTWLEEETLAYQRRGRLERAALCLTHCDPDRLRALITRQLPTDVI